MHPTLSILLVLATLTGGCSDFVPKKQHEDLKAKLEAVERELDELKNGPDRLLAEAKAQEAAGELLKAADACRMLIQRHPASSQANEGKTLLAEVERKHEEAEALRKRREADAEAKRRREEQEARRSDEKRLAQALRMMRKEEDEMRGVTFYKHQGSARYLSSRSELHAYFVVHKDAAPTLRFRLQYVGDDWLFIEQYIIKADDQTFRVEGGYSEVERDHGSGSIWEWIDLPVGQRERSMLNAVATAKMVTVRYVGKQYYRDRVIAPAERQRLAEVITAFDSFAPTKTAERQ